MAGGRRSTTEFALPLLHICANLLFGRPQRGWHAHTPSWKMANIIVRRDRLLDIHQAVVLRFLHINLTAKLYYVNSLHFFTRQRSQGHLYRRVAQLHAQFPFDAIVAQAARLRHKRQQSRRHYLLQFRTRQARRPR